MFLDIQWTDPFVFEGLLLAGCGVITLLGISVDNWMHGRDDD